MQESWEGLRGGPGRKAYSLGKVTLPVTFGTPANYRMEKIGRASCRERVCQYV